MGLHHKIWIKRWWKLSSEKPYFDRNFVCCTKKFNDKMVFLYLKHEAWNKNLNSKLGTKIWTQNLGTKIWTRSMEKKSELETRDENIYLNLGTKIWNSRLATKVWTQNLGRNFHSKLWITQLSPYLSLELKPFTLLDSKLGPKLNWTRNLGQKFIRKLGNKNLDSKLGTKIWTQNLERKFVLKSWEQKIWTQNLE